MPKGTFSLDVERFVKKAKGNATLVLRKVALDMFARVVMRSPVGNPLLWKNPAPPGYVGGRFRNNWYPAVNFYSTDLSASAPDKSGKASMQRINAVVGKAQLGDAITLVNNLPYAWPLETGWSKQAPAGMVGLTVLEFQPLVNRHSGGVV